MQIFDSGKVYDFMGKRFVFFAISLFLFVGSIVYPALKGLNYGIDFAGGTLIQLKYFDVESAPLGAIRAKLEKVFAGVTVTEFGTNDEVIIRYQSTTDNLGEDPGKYAEKLLADTGKFEVRRVDIVGPKVGDELRQKGVMALAISLALILVYIAVRFEWRFAMAAILCEVHDVIIVIGLIALLRIDVNLDTLAALLTILGYSLNDTIIIFDRIREDISKSKKARLHEVINEAVSLTLPRTLMTSITTFLAVAVLLFWGGDMIYSFSLIMIVGIFLGTYSSIFVAAPMLGWFRFNVDAYRKMLAEKEARKREKESMRAMYENGQV